jgi:hypothetical protein
MRHYVHTGVFTVAIVLFPELDPASPKILIVIQGNSAYLKNQKQHPLLCTCRSGSYIKSYVDYYDMMLNMC